MYSATIVLTTLLSLPLAFAAPHGLQQRQSNLQTFTGALGGIAATPILDSGNANRPFAVKADTFVNIGAALQRSCDQQFNACANAANGGDATLNVADCSAQKDQCTAAAQANAGQGANNNNNQNQNQNQNNNQNQNAGNGAVCTRKSKRNVQKA